ncbi:MAG: MutS-related protein [Saccharofermentanales bacterium]|jgi:DNA mismatch repair protein MutS2
MLIVRQEDRARLGLDDALEACRCHSPQGRRLKMARRFHGPDDRAALEATFDAIERLVVWVVNAPRDVRRVAGILSHFRDVHQTVTGLSEGRLLDVTELFEIKQALKLFRQLREHDRLLADAGVTLTPLEAAEATLDPSGVGTQGFYVYDQYSPELSALRADRSRIERAMAKADAALRAELLDERARLIEAEDAEETRVRGAICETLRPFAETMSENFRAVGILDFRLARAVLAVEWKAPRPRILATGEPCVLEACWHPVIADALEARGATYARQTMTLPQGTTVLSGPNMGGKSVTLKAVTLALTLIHMGYFPPAASAETPLFDFISYASDHVDTTRKGLSSFGAEVVRMRDDATRAKRSPGLVVMDEPCRGTNPEEATALIAAICRFYARQSGSLLVATHYRTPAGDRIQHVRIRGIRLEEALAEARTDQGGERSDEAAIRHIEHMMDYTLDVVDGAHPVPTDAIRIATWLGLDEDILDLIERPSKDDKEASWQN